MMPLFVELSRDGLDGPHVTAFAWLAAAGITIYAGGAAYDLWEVFHQPALHHARVPQRVLAPTVLPTQNRGVAPGMAFSARF